MTISNLARASIITTKRNSRYMAVTKFTPHYMCAAWSGETCAQYFRDCDRQVSANYCIGMDGGIVCNVPEEYRAWTSSSGWNDQRAITVEVANGAGGVVTQAAWDSLVALGADVMRRYGFRPYWTGDSSGSITCHYMFADTDCPGPYLRPRMGDLAVAIAAKLDATSKPLKPKPTVVPKREPGGELAMRTIQGNVSRLYNPYNGDHIYTTDGNESKSLVKSGFVNEGVIGKAPDGYALAYRLMNADTGEHLLTDDYSEASALVKQGKNLSDGTKSGWQSEGEPFIVRVGAVGPVKVHRLYKEGAPHLLTTDENEIKTLTAQGWRDEGVKFSLDRA